MQTFIELKNFILKSYAHEKWFARHLMEVKMMQNLFHSHQKLEPEGNLYNQELKFCSTCLSIQCNI